MHVFLFEIMHIIVCMNVCVCTHTHKHVTFDRADEDVKGKDAVRDDAKEGKRLRQIGENR